MSIAAVPDARIDAGAADDRGPTGPIVLVLLGAFWPGHDATGPNQSFKAMASALCGGFSFMVVGRDRPSGARSPMAKSGEWIQEGYVSARYVKVRRFGAVGLKEILRGTQHDLMSLHGFFDDEFTIPALILRRFGLIPPRPTILSPRGEFSPGALGLKNTRKQVYLKVVQKLGLVDDIWLHATGETEAEEIRAACPWVRRIVVAPNIRVLRPLPAPGCSDTPARLRLVFLSRIDRKKNLDYALQVLARLNEPVVLDIYGPVSDAAYWTACQRMVASLPGHIEVNYRGVIANDAVCTTLAGYDLFFLPTRGENFGHAILDALAAGVPVLISDQTPWRDLGRAGFALPLAEPAAFAAAIEQLVRLGPDERAAMRRAARSTAENAVKANDAIAATRSMLLAALRG